MEFTNFYGWEHAGVRNAAGMTLQHFYGVVRSLWCEYSCTPRMRKDWRPDNPSVGNCSITAFLVQDYFGGEVRALPLGDGYVHCYNVIEGHIFDFTSEQFGDAALHYDDSDPEQSRQAHFSRTEKKLRYEYLRDKVREKLHSA